MHSNHSSPVTSSGQTTPDPAPFESKTVVQIGCGVVGHAYAQAFVNAGHNVHGVEASRPRMAELADNYPMHHVSEDLSTLRDVDFILLSINTPLDPSTNALNMRYLWSSVPNVSAMLSSSPEALVVVRSTVTIGFCASFKSELADRVGRSVRLCFQPEFLRAKSALDDATRPWQVVLGADSPALVEDYRLFQTGFIAAEKIVHCSVDEAEIMKIFHNSFNAMKISYFNQAHMLIEKIKAAEAKDIDAERTFKIIARTCEGLLNPTYGLTPGHAYYGTCLPKDSAELSHMEKAYGLDVPLFRSVVDVNDVVKSTDKEEVMFGDNHAPNEAFHARLPALGNSGGRPLKADDLKKAGLISEGIVTGLAEKGLTKRISDVSVNEPKTGAASGTSPNVQLQWQG